MVAVACMQVAKDGLAVALRPVTEVDLLTLYRWRRRFLLPPVAPRSRALDLDEHRRWFTSLTTSPDCILKMVLHGGTPAGLLRLDRRRRDGDDVWDVALLIRPARRRSGIPAAALALGRNMLPHAELVARVLPDSGAPLDLFVAAGYKRCRDGLYRSLPSPE